MSCESTCVLLCGSEPLKFVLFLHKIWCVCRRPVNHLTFPTFYCWHVQYLGKWVSCYVSFEILTAVTVESIVSWAVTLCSVVEVYWLWLSQVRALSYDSNKLTNKMQQYHTFITWHLCVAQHVSGASTPIIRSIQLPLAASGFTVGAWSTTTL